MKKLLLVCAVALTALSGCVLADQAIGTEEEPGPLVGIVGGIEKVTAGTPIGGIAALLMGAFGFYQRARAKKYSQAVEGVVVGIDRGLEQGIKLSVEKQELYNKIREGLLEVSDDIAFAERLIADIKAKERA